VNPRLDPKVIRASMRSRFQRQLALCASLLLVLGWAAPAAGRRARCALTPRRRCRCRTRWEAHRIFATDRLRRWK